MVKKGLTPPANCFVICPFGNERTSAEEARIFAEINNLGANVFRPVEQNCAEAGQPVRILDARDLNDVKPDTIRDKVIELIDAADVVLTVMTADKPNGFIEYGWAMGMWKKPIILCSADYRLPTNINNALAIEYDPDHLDGSHPKRLQKVIDQLTEQVLRQLSEKGRKPPFAHFPPTMLAHGAIDVLGRFRDVSIREWSDMIRNAHSEIIVASNAMFQITKQPFQKADGSTTDIESLLLERALAGVRVTVVMQHPTNASLGHLRRNSLKSGVEEARGKLQTAYDIWATVRRSYQRIARDPDKNLRPDGFRVIQLHDRFLPFRATMTENRLYLTLRFYTQLFNSGLCIVAGPDAEADDDNPSVYSQIREELNFLITENEAASEDSYRTWLESHAG
ncbi:MAG: hypothetical protein AAFZ99_09990 [Pseudomonadota bacterium]